MSIETIQQNPEMKAYFDSLPPAVQETIVQSGIQVTDLAGLKQCAQTFSTKQ